MVKIISWNVNGLRALFKKDKLYEIFNYNPNIICLSETKLGNSEINTIEIKEEIKKIFPKKYNYIYISNSQHKKGYSGTAIISVNKPLNVYYGLKDHNNIEIDNEGRIIVAEYPKYYLINVYTPNAGEGLINLDRRIAWDIAFRNYMIKLYNKKYLIICGDLNVAHHEIDVSFPKKRKNSACFTLEERQNFTDLLSNVKLIDIFRYLNPELQKFTFWSYRSGSINTKGNRAINNGWRLDYFLVSEKIFKKSIIFEILNTLGSDHAPIYLKLNI